MFIGPTGVGKTELAETLADFLFNDSSSMTRDMSEYQEIFSFKANWRSSGLRRL